MLGVVLIVDVLGVLLIVDVLGVVLIVDVLVVCCVDEEDKDGVNISHDISPGGLVDGILLLELHLLLTWTSLALAPRVNEFDLNSTAGGV